VRPFYRTGLGRAYCADCLDVMKTLPKNSVDLVLTSPPFALRRKKSYGNVSAEKYVDWFWPFAAEIRRVLKPNGSFVLDIGGSWNRGEPTRTLYHFDLLTKLCGKKGPFRLAQEFYWFNPAKMPAPAQWVTIERVRVKDSINPIWWLSKTARPKASNRRVLRPYTDSMRSLMRRGYNQGLRPSGYVVSAVWGTDHGGSIPPNVIVASNTRSFDPYLRACRGLRLPIHPARFVQAVPDFFVKFLTVRGNIVLDPFAGSNVVGGVAQQLGRRWISVDLDEAYVLGSAFRFHGAGEALVRRLKAGPEWRRFRRRLLQRHDHV
jgi:DNA modification methylase